MEQLTLDNSRLTEENKDLLGTVGALEVKVRESEAELMEKTEFLTEKTELLTRVAEELAQRGAAAEANKEMLTEANQRVCVCVHEMIGSFRECGR